MTTRKNTATPEEIVSILRLLKFGRSVNYIASNLGVSRYVVLCVLAGRGVDSVKTN